MFLTKSKLTTFFSVVLLVPTFTINAQTGLNKQQLLEMRKKLPEVAKQTPMKKLIVTADFRKGLSAKEVIAMIRGNSALRKTTAAPSISTDAIKVLSFRHDVVGVSGGYVLQPGQTLEQAIRDYQAGYPDFIEELKENGEKMKNSADESERKDADGILKEAYQRKEANDKFGLLITGLQIEGDAVNLETFRKINTSKISAVNIQPN